MNAGTIAQGGALDHADLKADTGSVEQPGLTLQLADERVQVIVMNRAHHLMHAKCLPWTFRCRIGEVECALCDVLDERHAARTLIDMSAELAIVRDGTLQQQCRNVLVLEAGGAHERLVHHGEISDVIAQPRTYVVKLAPSGEELECAGKRAFAVEQLQQAFSACSNETVAYRRRDDRAGIDQHLGTLGASEVMLSERIEAVAEGACRHPEQPAVILGVAPGKQGRVFRNQLLQACHIVVVNDTARLRYGPTEIIADAPVHFGAELLPTGVAIFAREHELSVSLRERELRLR